MNSSDIDWELEEGIPQVDDPFIQQYLKGRTSLVLEEQKQRYDTNLRKALSPVATKACDIVSKIRARDLTILGLNEGNPRQLNPTPQTSHIPQLNRDEVQKTDLWRILQKMPKGSLLHAHMETMLDIDFVIEEAFKTPGIHIYAPKPLTTQRDYEEGIFYFQYSPSVQHLENKPVLWDPGYEPSSLISLQEAASSFPDGEEAGFHVWLKKRCIFPSAHSYHHGFDNILNAYKTLSSVVNSLLSYEPIFRSCLRRMFSQIAADGISYVELRNSFTFPYRQEGSSAPEEDYSAWCHAFQEELESFKGTEEGKTICGARIIWTTSRTQSNREISGSMINCILAKQDFPEVICGFDVIGQGDDARSLVDLVPILFWFRKQCAEEGVDIPFLFHTGENGCDDKQAEHDLFDAILLGARRLGPGESLYKHPLLLELIKEKKILVECCPIVKGINSRTNFTQVDPLSVLLSRGISVSLSSYLPDLSESGLNSLTFGFWQALQGPDNLELPGLAMMVENSIRWSCYEDQPPVEWLSDIREGILGEGTKAARLRDWYACFEKFCEWITLEFAEVDIS
ncbi:adenosine deaminase family protein [Aspergillus bombycis]|uniref:adenosine deaminase n=1 Tax=Aspergillus bombycis TaxID=109264 RepID=A0A1F8AE59_9EURO|nr:adenosine deaminase family protein [Aspergillus bombycis]OGM49982.1 adenosine deaminase family protein [Aspergillus bombycis]